MMELPLVVVTRITQLNKKAGSSCNFKKYLKKCNKNSAEIMKWAFFFFSALDWWQQLPKFPPVERDFD